MALAPTTYHSYSPAAELAEVTAATPSSRRRRRARHGAIWDSTQMRSIQDAAGLHAPGPAPACLRQDARAACLYRTVAERPQVVAEDSPPQGRWLPQRPLEFRHAPRPVGCWNLAPPWPHERKKSAADEARAQQVPVTAPAPSPVRKGPAVATVPDPANCIAPSSQCSSKHPGWLTSWAIGRRTSYLAHACSTDVLTRPAPMSGSPNPSHTSYNAYHCSTGPRARFQMPCPCLVLHLRICASRPRTTTVRAVAPGKLALPSCVRPQLGRPLFDVLRWGLVAAWCRTCAVVPSPRSSAQSGGTRLPPRAGQQANHVPMAVLDDRAIIKSYSFCITLSLIPFGNCW
ncbi:hypothetical protein EJ04DRAFT_520773 [Polyplosphaeria fusca]|uniref:Uncharacterized protein n=1 Tax=Polyplosphaeria fusca TaxID=682080 RepID=A0A9P4V606_9PLEO|nr:hypothetical protein EJ04DRAFT_520773 [Polyplosphaeria fusca]